MDKQPQPRKKRRASSAGTGTGSNSSFDQEVPFQLTHYMHRAITVGADQLHESLKYSIVEVLKSKRDGNYNGFKLCYNVNVTVNIAEDIFDIEELRNHWGSTKSTKGKIFNYRMIDLNKKIDDFLGDDVHKTCTLDTFISEMYAGDDPIVLPSSIFYHLRVAQEHIFYNGYSKRLAEVLLGQLTKVDSITQIFECKREFQAMEYASKLHDLDHNVDIDCTGDGVFIPYNPIEIPTRVQSGNMSCDLCRLEYKIRNHESCYISAIIECSSENHWKRKSWEVTIKQILGLALSLRHHSLQLGNLSRDEAALPPNVTTVVITDKKFYVGKINFKDGQDQVLELKQYGIFNDGVFKPLSFKLFAWDLFDCLN